MQKLVDWQSCVVVLKSRGWHCNQYRHSSESWEAVGALARHVVLKAPDKANYRAVATEAAVELVTELPAMNQHQFVLFAARLARTPKVTALE